MVQFAPCRKEVTAEEYARLFVDTVFRYHGMPEVIISNRDPRFTSKFWTQLFKLLGTDLRFSTAFHPQTDGQSEVTIRVLENFLRLYVEWHSYTWIEQFSLGKFTTSNAKSASTRFTPFYLNSGQDPLVPNTLLGTKIPTANEAVAETMDRLKGALDGCKDQLDDCPRMDKTTGRSV